MPPAIEFGCNCNNGEGFKVKTADEPDSPESMNALFIEVAHHAAIGAMQNLVNLRKKGTNFHTTGGIIFHEKTPKKGFKNTIVVKNN